MTLLSGGPDAVSVWTNLEQTDAYGNVVIRSSRAVDADPVVIRGRVQPATAEEETQLGQTLGTVYRFLCRSFPANAFGEAQWNGRMWDIVGDPRRHNGSTRTRHVTVYLRAQSSATHEVDA